MAIERRGKAGRPGTRRNEDYPADRSALGARHITALEINPVMAELAKRNVEGNHREDYIQVIHCDYTKANVLFPSGYFQSVVVNPPYREVGTGNTNSEPGKALACHELGASLRYLSQRYSMPYPELKGLLTDIGTEEAS